jgi:ABC-type glutathione transport system ATPase component
MKIATRVLVMHQGEIVRDGTPEAIMQQVVKARPAVALSLGERSGEHHV